MSKEKIEKLLVLYESSLSIGSMRAAGNHLAKALREMITYIDEKTVSPPNENTKKELLEEKAPAICPPCDVTGDNKMPDEKFGATPEIKEKLDDGKIYEVDPQGRTPEEIAVGNEVERKSINKPPIKSKS